MPALRYSPPTDAGVLDPFRAPASRYGPGNLGLEYDTIAGSSVTAIGVGRVTFAGQVAGRLVVVVTHPDGLRSSYVDLAAIDVALGDEVANGDWLGRAGDRLHLGVRRGDVYLDPALLFAVRRHAVLVGPHEPARIDARRATE